MRDLGKGYIYYFEQMDDLKQEYANLHYYQIYIFWDMKCKVTVIQLNEKYLMYELLSTIHPWYSIK